MQHYLHVVISLHNRDKWLFPDQFWQTERDLRKEIRNWREIQKGKRAEIVREHSFPMEIKQAK